MKKFLLLLALGITLFAQSLQGQVLFSEDFTSTTALSTWTTINADGDTGTAKNWMRSTLSGNGILVSYSWFNSPLTPNNYIFTPAIDLTAATGTIKLFYKHASTDADWDEENYSVYVTTAPTVAAATTPVYTISDMDGINQLTEVSIDLSSYAGQTVYIGFRHYDVTDQFNVVIDDVKVEKLVNNEAKLVNVSLGEIYTPGNINITGTVKNGGLSPLTSYDLSWQVDGGAINTQQITGLNLAYGATHDFTHSTPWAAVAGSHTVNVTISNINGAGNDTTLTDNTISKTVYVVNEVFPRNVVYEEATGTWCGWCVRGHVGLKDMHHSHNDGTWIGIAVHGGSTTEPMKVTDYITPISARISGYPSGLINRSGQEVDPGTETLEEAYDNALTKVPLGKISISNLGWDSATRQISIEVTSKFALDIANANYTAGVIVVEDGVVGTTSTYNQANYYNSNGIDIIDWEGINWRNLPNPILAANMVYNHVGRALVGGFNGQAGSVPASVTYNTPYTYTFTHTLPATQNENKIKLVAVLINNGSTEKEIVNAHEVALSTLQAPTFNQSSIVTIYPNPSNGVVKFVTNSELQIEVFDLLGKSVFKKAAITDGQSVDLSNLENGVYTIVANNGTAVDTHKLIIKK